VDPMESIRQTFFLECEEQLTELEAGLLALEAGQAEPDTVNAVFRAVHSIKGGAGAFKLHNLVQFSHAFETVLDRVRCSRLQASPHVMKTMIRAADILSDLVAAARDQRELASGAWQGVEGELRSLCSDTEGPAPAAPTSGTGAAEEAFSFTPALIALDFPPPEPQPSCVTIKFKPADELYAKANEVVPIFRELARLGSVAAVCCPDAVPHLEDLNPLGAYLSWTIELKTSHGESAIREAFEFVEGDCLLEISCPAPDAGLGFDNASNELGAATSQPEEEAAKVVDFAPREIESTASATSALSAAQASASSSSGSGKAETGAGPGLNQSQPTIRVDFERVDRLINLVGELVINQAMLSQRIIEAGVGNSPSVAIGLDELEHLTREIQEGVMAIRAQPVRPLFQRMARIVREVADSTGKAVRLRTEGEATEIDKTVVERLADPLTHMIRNAIDHGVEAPEQRTSLGKPAEGQVRLTAGHKSGRVVIEVADDGAGIDRPRVKAIAIKKGLISVDAQLTDTEIDNLLFLPGFSTASTVSNISGRGVGMDVVKRSIQALGGRISIASQPGAGSTFTLSLPLTLAVLDGMVVAVSGQTFVIPLTAIIETVKPSPASVHPLGVGSRVIAVRESFLPIIDVGSELGIREPLTAAHTGVAILVETEGGAQNALLVDAIQDQRQVVIKSLEANYGQTPGVAAATILGDGRVALILDVDALVNRRRSESTSYEMPIAVGA